jgi:imidazolonepropionase-like amidohydrolase
VATMAATGTALVPTLINIDTFPELAAGARKYPAYAGHMLQLHARVADTVRMAIEAGVPVYAGTDAGGGIAHGRLVDEIEALHRVGMSPEQALGAGSWAARGWLGYSGIEDGSAADIVAYPTDPRKDLGVLRTPQLIMLRGRIIS